MVLKLNAQQLQTIVTHAQGTYPEECCGLLLGTIDPTGKTVVEVKPIENTWSANENADEAATLTKTRRYAIAPQAMLATMREARDRNLTLIGIYHSHPDNPAQPSECDRQLAWQTYSYAIVSVQQGRAIDWQSWTLDEVHQFQPEEILTMRM